VRQNRRHKNETKVIKILNGKSDESGTRLAQSVTPSRHRGRCAARSAEFLVAVVESIQQFVSASVRAAGNGLLQQPQTARTQ